MGSACNMCAADRECEVIIIGIPPLPPTLIAEGLPMLSYQEHSLDSEYEPLPMLLLPALSNEQSIRSTPRSTKNFSGESWSLPTSDQSPCTWKNQGLKNNY